LEVISRVGVAIETRLRVYKHNINTLTRNINTNATSHNSADKIIDASLRDVASNSHVSGCL